mmetsp:Transcript_9819/g.26172  ORF Transcript_9819/g.26172 Transcript_9819/m.26172 type:complete len:268 (-) Transcript_9819:12-815(-)
MRAFSRAKCHRTSSSRIERKRRSIFALTFVLLFFVDACHNNAVVLVLKAAEHAQSGGHVDSGVENDSADMRAFAAPRGLFVLGTGWERNVRKKRELQNAPESLCVTRQRLRTKQRRLEAIILRHAIQRAIARRVNRLRKSEQRVCRFQIASEWLFAEHVLSSFRASPRDSWLRRYRQRDADRLYLRVIDHSIEAVLAMKRSKSASRVERRFVFLRKRFGGALRATPDRRNFHTTFADQRQPRTEMDLRRKDPGTQERHAHHPSSSQK